MDAFAALADPTRREIIDLLASSGQMPASAIARRFPISAPAISQHLKLLREAQLVTMQKRKQQRLYQLNPQAMNEMEGWLRQMTERWEARYHILDEILEAEKQKQTPKGDPDDEQE